MCLELIFGLKKIVVYFLFQYDWSEEPIIYFNCKIIEHFKIKYKRALN